jgi:hypothetical protein
LFVEAPAVGKARLPYRFTGKFTPQGHDGVRAFDGQPEHPDPAPGPAMLHDEAKLTPPTGATRQARRRRPAVEEETSRALGEGAWQPSLLWVDVIELLDEPHAGKQSERPTLGKADRLP